MDEDESLEQSNGFDSRRENPREVLRGLFYLAVAIAIIVFLVIDAINTVQVMTGKEIATATVISTFDDVRESGRRAGMITVADYRFIVNNTEYYGGTEVSQGSLSEGDQLTIKYNKKDPTKNRRAGDRELLARLTLFLMFGGMAVYLLIGTSIDKLKHSRPEK